MSDEKHRLRLLLKKVMERHELAMQGTPDEQIQHIEQNARELRAAFACIVQTISEANPMVAGSLIQSLAMKEPVRNYGDFYVLTWDNQGARHEDATRKLARAFHVAKQRRVVKNRAVKVFMAGRVIAHWVRAGSKRNDWQRQAPEAAHSEWLDIPPILASQPGLTSGL